MRRHQLPCCANINRSRGFTLVELSVVLVIVALLASGVFGVATLLMKRAEIKDTEDKVKLLKDQIVGYALSNQRLPEYASGAGTDEISTLGISNRDLLGQKLTYIYDPQLVRSDLSSVICAKKTTNIQIRQCYDAACTTPPPTVLNNIAFIVFSRGHNLINQTGSATAPHTESAPDPSYSGPDGTSATPKIISTFPPGLLVGPYTTPTSNKTSYDDITAIVTLEELRQKLSCQGTPLRIVNTDLPMGAQNTSYSATVFVEGGVPIQPPTNGKYRWCAESSVASATFTAIALPKTVVGATETTIPLGALGSCAVALENSASWVQGDDFRLRGAGPPVNFLPLATGAGTYDITVYVRDNQSNDGTATPLATTDLGDNIVSKRFVLAISGS